MKRIQLSDMTTNDLVERFAQIGVAQDRALLGGEITKFNRLFDQMSDVANELKSREGDQRRALMVLYYYPNIQVRLKAAKLPWPLRPSKRGSKLKRSRPRTGCPRRATPVCRSGTLTGVCTNRPESPREYLHDKSWEERRQFGLDTLVRFKVLKP
jgi:hypothetical protein